ncbi:hypothetical protein BCR35DRAFT_304536 [Leucosporidium creatinivorum]|uniref:DUF7918 domain-containing protein n=1 Tax=Leucosporidium creatinivorum TaxID=106004 RepID=A0A1Y2F8P0_9BASI|nr:hypothetical protein BCR35DRAFT_304536 [Leucosporidium creatinivorum]
MAEQDASTILSSPLLPGFECWISVNDQPTPVYAVSSAGRKVACFIESVEGAPFKVQFSRLQSPQAYSAHVYLDGRRVHGMILEPSFTSVEPRMSTVAATRVSPTEERPFLFNKLAQTDDEDLACYDEAVVRGIGTVQLNLFRVANLRRNQGEVPCHDMPNVIMHEQSKKAQLSHQTAYGPPQATTPIRATRVDYVDPLDDPMITFTFSYRSRILLELQDIIPPLPAPASPSPAPAAASASASATPPVASGSGAKRSADLTINSDSDSDDNADGLTELERLRARVAELERRERIKKESGVKEERGIEMEKDVKPSLKRVKREGEGGSGSGGSAKKGKGKMEVIELD